MDETADPTPARSPGRRPARASEWLVALAESPDDRVLQAGFDAWLAASPDHAIDWEEMTHTVAVMGMTGPVHRGLAGAAAVQAPSDAAPLNRPQPIRHDRRPGGRRRAALGVSMALAASLLLALFPGLLVRWQADHRTGTAEQRTVQLDDGTLVRLAPESAIDIAFTKDRRQVRLLTGEAFIEVAPDPDRPFALMARDLETTDIGTAFDVRMGNAGADVSVRDGLVQVDRRSGDGSTNGPPLSERLGAGERVHVGWSGGVRRDRLPPDQVAPWLQGQLIVKQRPVAEVVDALRPYFHGLILLRGERLAHRPLTGVYNLSSPLDALKAVAAAEGATIHRISPWLLLVSEH